MKGLELRFAPARERKNVQVKFTARETEVLALLAAGYSHKEAAHRLNITIKTVQNHRQNVMDKTGRHNVAALTHLAIKLKLVELQ